MTVLFLKTENGPGNLFHFRMLVSYARSPISRLCLSCVLASVSLVPDAALATAPEASSVKKSEKTSDPKPVSTRPLTAAPEQINVTASRRNLLGRADTASEGSITGSGDPTPSNLPRRADIGSCSRSGGNVSFRRRKSQSVPSAWLQPRSWYGSRHFR